jgi:hypothetical protein
MLRAGSPWIVRSLARASARMSGLGSRHMVWWSSPDRAILDSRWCDHSYIRVVYNVRRICCPLFPLGFESHRSSSALTGSLGAPVVVGSEFSPYLSGVLVWSRPVLFPPSFRSSDGPAHTSPVGTYLGTYTSRAACCGRRTLSKRTRPGASGTHNLGRLWPRSLPGGFDVVLGRELLDRDDFV